MKRAHADHADIAAERVSPSAGDNSGGRAACPARALLAQQKLIDIVCVRAGRRSDDDGAVLQRGGCARGTLPRREHFHGTRTQLALVSCGAIDRIDAHTMSMSCDN